MNLVYLSSDPIGIPCLEHLAAGRVDGIRLTGIVTAPDRRQGRGKKLKRNPIAAIADSLHLPLLQTERLEAQALEALAPFDGALIFAFGQILSTTVLATRPGKFLNLHPSPLPQLRGPSPLETALAEGWESTEICLMQVAKRMDAGPVAARIPLEITADDFGSDLRHRAAIGCTMLLDQLPAALQGSHTWSEQEEPAATWSRIIHKRDGWVDFSLPSQRIASRSRAFAGWPGSFIRLNGESVRVASIQAIDGDGAPGEILEARDRLVIAAGTGAVSIGSLQRPTRRLLSWEEFRRSTALQEGQLLSYPLSRPLIRHTQKL